MGSSQSDGGLERIIDLFTDPLDMIRAIRRESNKSLNIWGPSLLFPQALGGVYFINTREGIVVLVSLILMLVSAGYIHRHAPLSRIIGICQAWWLLIIPWLFKQALHQETLTIFSGWLWYVTVTIIISLLLDVYGVHLYLTTDNKSYREKR